MKLRFALIVAAVVLGVVGVALLGSEASKRSEFTSKLSSYSAAPEGGRALYALAGRLGLEPRRLVHNLEVIPETGTIVSIAPKSGAASFFSFLFSQSAFTDKEVEAIGRWVAEGNTFVLIARNEDELNRGFALSVSEAVPDALDEDVLPGRRARATRREDIDWPPATGAAGLAMPLLRGFEGVERLEVGHKAGTIKLRDFEGEDEVKTWDRISGYTPLVVAEDGRVVAAEVRCGEGRFVLLTSTYVGTNSGLPKADNALFLVRLLSKTPETPSEPGDKDNGLWFDEFHHGFANDRSLAGYLRDSSLWIVVCQLCFLLLAVGWRYQVRFGDPLPLYEEELRGSGDYLKAMSQIYQRGGHNAHALGVLLDDLDRRLVEKYRLRPGLAGDRIAAALADTGQQDVAKQVRSLRQDAARLAAKGRLADRDLVAIARGLSRFTESMR